MVTRYGLISDIHTAKLDDVLRGIDVLKDEGIDELILNGDLSWGVSDKNGREFFNIDNFEKLIEYVAKQDIPTYFLPGDKDNFSKFEAYVSFFSFKNPHIFYTIDRPVIHKKDHTLIFLPGGEVEDGFSLEDSIYETGRYEWARGGFFRIINMNDLKKYMKDVDDPEKAILFSHIPIKFNTLRAVDVDEAFVDDSFKYNEKYRCFKKGYLSLKDAKLGSLKQRSTQDYIPKNVGSSDLEKIVKDVGIKKHITGHTHYSVHRAHDLHENPVNENEWTNELFFMASYMDKLKLGMIDVDENRVRYFRVNLKDYIKGPL